MIITALVDEIEILCAQVNSLDQERELYDSKREQLTERESKIHMLNMKLDEATRMELEKAIEIIWNDPLLTNFLSTKELYQFTKKLVLLLNILG